MESPCVYILHGDRFYIGATNNLEQRLEQHRHKSCHATKRIGSWKLQKVIPCTTMDEAFQLEQKIKKSGHPERWI